MELAVGERLTLLGIVPRIGSLATLRIVRDLIQELSFGEEETKAIGLRQEGDQYAWNPGAPEKDVAFGEVGTQLVADALKDVLKALDEKEELGLQHLSLGEKFKVDLPEPSARAQ